MALPTNCASPKWFNRVVAQIYAIHIKEIIPFGFQSHVFLMRVTGIWPTTNDSRWYKWLTIAFFLFVGVLFPFTMFVNIFMVNTIQEAMDHSFLSLSCWTSAFKACVIYQRRDSLRKLFIIHGNLCDDSSNRHKERLDRIAWINIRIHTALMTLYFLTTCTVVIQVIFAEPMQGFFSSTSHFPYAWARQRSVYLIVLVFQIVCALGIVAWTAIEDSLSIGLINTICGHVAELKERLEAVGTIATEGVPKNLNFYRELIDCCKRYAIYLRLAIVHK